MGAAAEQLLVKGEGGVEFVFDVPTPGSVQDELLRAKITKGELVILDGVLPDPPEAEPGDGEGSATGEAGGSPSGVPPKSAKVDVWRVYAIGQGMPEDEANAATKAELIREFGG